MIFFQKVMNSFRTVWAMNSMKYTALYTVDRILPILPLRYYYG